MTRSYLVAPEAERQILDALIWWHENRPKAPGLLEEEIERAIALAVAQPEAGACASSSRFQNLRRVLLRKTRYHLYYMHDLVQDEIHIVGFWHGERGAPPPL
jgi:plasmid stabilization system protein ParE